MGAEVYAFRNVKANLKIRLTVTLFYVIGGILVDAIQSFGVFFGDTIVDV